MNELTPIGTQGHHIVLRVNLKLPYERVWLPFDLCLWPYTPVTGRAYSHSLQSLAWDLINGSLLILGGHYSITLVLMILEPHLEVLWADFWLCTHGLLLVGWKDQMGC